MLKNSPLRLVKLTDDLNDILDGCVHGQRNAQEKLYRMLSARMFGVCMRYCRDYNEAKDVLQDGFIKVFENIKKFEHRGSFEGWVRRIIVNTAIEKFRKSKPETLYDKLPDIAEYEDNDPEIEVTHEELLNLVQELPPQYRLVFNLYVFEEMTHKEISNMLSISEGTSKSNLSRARGILQQKLKALTLKNVKVG